MSRSSLAWISVAAGAFGAALIAATGIAGLGYALIYALSVLPGILLGRRLVGGWHPAGVAIGGLIGYGTTQLALWVPIYLGIASAVTFVLAWLVLAVCLVWISRRLATPILPLSAPTPADVRALALTLLLVPLVMGPPYRNLGAADETGTRYYRAYFTADFVWHTALAAEIGRYDAPPRNPYMASERLHYYWAYFLLPAVVAEEAPRPLDDVQNALKANAMMSAILFVWMFFVFVRLAVPAPGWAAAAVWLGMVATSAEGAFVLQQLWRAGRSLAAVTEMNVDAITAWQFNGLRIDGLPRGLWYNPQHSFSCALGLVAMAVAASSGARASRGAVWLAGAALGLSTCFNPFVGGIFSVVYGIAVTIDAIRAPGTLAALLRHGQAAVPVLLGLGWCLLNDVAGGAGTAVAFGFRGAARTDTIRSLLLSTGPVLVPAAIGLWPWRLTPALPALVAAVGAAVSLLVMHLVTLSESSWVGFRTGQVLQLMLPVLLARALWGLSTRATGLSGALVVLVLLAGLPTTAIDTYNAHDIGNRAMGPGFRWTLAVTPAQQAAFAWVRRNVPPDATLQMEPMLRGREHWSLIPTFAERRMVTGLPISLLPRPVYEARSLDVRRLFSTGDPGEAWRLARGLGIQFLYVDADDRAAYPAGVAKFQADPNFEAVYDAGGVTVYHVR